jgi:hypothetical protein
MRSAGVDGPKSGKSARSRPAIALARAAKRKIYFAAAAFAAVSNPWPRSQASSKPVH